MKRRTHFLLSISSFLFLLLGYVSMTAQNAQEPRPRIQVTGTATISLAPDELTMNVAIRHENSDAKKTVEAYRSTREQVLSTLRKFGVADTNITEQGLSFVKQTERDYKTGRVTREYYQAATTINIVVRKFDTYPDLVIALSSLPGVELGYVSYRSSKEIETRQKARIQAMEAAKKKATDMAAVCDAKLGEPLLITENNTSNPYAPVQSNVAYGGIAEERDVLSNSSLVVSSDAIQVRASVYVEFALE